MWVCCLDSESLEIFNRLSLEGITAVYFKNIMYEELEYYSRDEFEKYIKPYFMIYVTKNHVNTEYVIYIEHDCYLLANPWIIFNMNPCSSLYLIKNAYLGLKNKKQENYSSSIILFYRSKVYFDCLYWWKKKGHEAYFEYKRKSVSVESLCIAMWPKLFNDIKKVKYMESCENRKVLDYVKCNRSNRTFYIKANQVLAVKPYSIKVISKDELVSPGIKELREYVCNTLKAAEEELEK
jgi:hypothetical protein